MRNLGKMVRKVLSVIVLMALMLNSSMLMIISEAVDAVQNEGQEEEKIKAIANMTLQKYVNYEIGENKGTLIQTQIETGIEYAEGEEYKPLKASGIVVNSPKIEEEYPESVYVIAKSTKATNGREENKEANYRYDNTTGELQIVAVNSENENGEIYNVQDNNARDIYEIIYYYGSNCYTDTNAKREIEISARVVEQIYDEQETVFTTDINLKEEVTENKKDLISTNIETSEIYNGYIKANKENGTQNTTEYTEKTKIDISYKELADEIIVNSKSKFVNTNDEEKDTEEIIYKNTKINKQEVLNILGEDGKLQILNQAQEVIKEINKDTETNEQGIVEINYENEIREITIKTSKPAVQGTITIENTKYIKETMQDVENNKIKTETTINEYTEDNIAEIKDSTSKVDLSIDKTTLTNETSNDVTLTAVLKTNDIKYNLFKNPTIEIELPTEVEKIILGEVSLVYDESLKLKSATVEGNKIKVEVEGTQTKYLESNSMYEGANIQIPATIIVKKDIESTKTNIKTRHTNESGNVTEESNLEINIDSILQPQVMLMAEEPVAENAETVNGLAIETTVKVGSDILNDGDAVYEKEVINYTVKITNTTENTINNLKIEGNVPEGTTFVEKDGSIANPDRTEEDVEEWNDLFIYNTEKQEVVIAIESLEAGKTIEKTYKVMVNDLENETQKDINATIITSINSTELQNKTINVIAKDAKLSIDLYPGIQELEGIIDYAWSYRIDVKNQTNEKLENVVVELDINEVLDYSWDSTKDYALDFDKDNRILKINIGALEANSKETFEILLSAKNFEENKYIYDIPVNARVYANNTDKYRADTDNKVAYSTDVSIVMDSTPIDKSKITSFETVKYKIKVTNHGLVNRWVKIEDKLPEGIIPTEAKYEMFTYNENDELEKITQTESIDDEDGFVLETLMDKESSIEIILYGYAEPVDETIEVENVAIVSGEQIDTKQSNGIVYTILSDEDYYNNGSSNETEDPSEPGNPIEPSDPTDPTDPTDPSNPSKPDDTNTPSKEGKSKISGLVWIDANKDGQRDEDEEALSGITVKLFNANTSEIVADKKGNARKTTTNKKGEYEFSELQNGDYLVLFEYDTNTYVLTSYKKNGVSTTVNSDVIKKEVSIDGNEKEVGLTDKLTISNNNLSNIDMGLIKNPVFDFKLDKYVSKVTVANETGTKEKNFKNKKLAKVEIAAKQLNNSLVTIEYKIVVTNEGEVDGFINKVVDYLPDGLTFDSAINTNWDKSSDGTLTNTELSTQKIQPGESREITLVLTKQMTENSTGSVINTAEIKELNNTKNLSDRNKENDSSNAEVIIGVKTGIITYTIIILIALVVVALLIKYNKKIKPNVVGMFTFIAIISMSLVSVAVSYMELGYHYTISGGKYKWTSVHGGASNYWCLEPGQHLGDYETYKEHFTKTFKTQKDAEAFVKSYGLQAVKGDAYDTLIAKEENFSPKASLKFNSIEKGSNYTISESNGWTTIGPLTLNYDANVDIKNITIQKIQINGSEISNYDKNNLKIESDGKTLDRASGDKTFKISKSSGANKSFNIYIKIKKTDIADKKISIKLKLQTENKKYKYVKATVYTPISCSHGYSYWKLQLLAKFIPTEEDSEASQSLVFGDGYPDGNEVSLQILKVDKDKFDTSTEGTLNGRIDDSEIESTETEINIKDDNDNYDVTQTASLTYDENGNVSYAVSAIAIPDGKYTITETAAPTSSGYSLERQKEMGLDISLIEILTENKIAITKVDEKPTSLENDQLYAKYDGEHYRITSELIENFKYGVKRKDTDITATLYERTDPITEKAKVCARFKIKVAMPNKRYGDLMIKKVDDDDGSYVSGAKFRLKAVAIESNIDISRQYVTCDENGNAKYTDDENEMITMTSSPFTIKNLYPGTYTLEEIAAPNGYDINVQLNTTANVEIKDPRDKPEEEKDEPEYVEFRNKRYGVLRITKVDKDTDKKIPNIGFKVQYDGKYISIYNGNEWLENVNDEISVNPVYHKSTVYIGDNEHVYTNGCPNDECKHEEAHNQLHCHITSEDKATTFYTNSFGEIRIENLIQGTYLVKETSIIGEEANYYEPNPNDIYELVVKAYLPYDLAGKISDATQDMVSYIRKDTDNAITNLNKEEETRKLFEYIVGRKIDDNSADDQILLKTLLQHSGNSLELIEYISKGGYYEKNLQTETQILELFKKLTGQETSIENVDILLKTLKGNSNTASSYIEYLIKKDLYTEFIGNDELSQIVDEIKTDFQNRYNSLSSLYTDIETKKNYFETEFKKWLQGNDRQALILDFFEGNSLMENVKNHLNDANTYLTKFNYTKDISWQLVQIAENLSFANGEIEELIDSLYESLRITAENLSGNKTLNLESALKTISDCLDGKAKITYNNLVNSMNKYEITNYIIKYNNIYTLLSDIGDELDEFEKTNKDFYDAMNDTIKEPTGGRYVYLSFYNEWYGSFQEGLNSRYDNLKNSINHELDNIEGKISELEDNELDNIEDKISELEDNNSNLNDLIDDCEKDFGYDSDYTRTILGLIEELNKELGEFNEDFEKISDDLIYYHDKLTREDFQKIELKYEKIKEDLNGFARTLSLDRDKYSETINNTSIEINGNILDRIRSREDGIKIYFSELDRNKNKRMKEISESDEIKEEYVKNIWKLYCKEENRPIKESEIDMYKAWISGERTLRIENPQKWTTIEGMVWEEQASDSKNNTSEVNFDGIYNNNTEKKMSGVMVKLMKDGKPLRTEWTGEDNNGDDEADQEDGKYVFKKVELVRDEKGYLLEEQPYYVEFVYDGLKYTSTIIVEPGEDDITSKARETDDSRKTINNRFKEVTKGEIVGNQSEINIGNEENNYTITELENSKAIATYNYKTWEYSENGMIINASKANRQIDSDIYDVKATTSKVVKGEDFKILNVNLGVLKREQPNAAIVNSDIDNIKVTVNGHTSIYKYGKNNYANTDQLENGQLVAQVSSYRRAIKPSYVKSIEDFNGNGNQLKIYVTYKIDIRNASNTLTMDINKLVDYYDGKYKNDNITAGTRIQTDITKDNYYGLEDGEQFNVQSDDTENNGYKTSYISRKDNTPMVTIPHGEDASIYVQYEVEEDSKIKILDNTETELNNIVEILSYTTRYGESTESRINPDRKGQIYAAIDTDSAPGNVIAGETTNYENDTGILPTMKLYVGEEKVIKGNVFEDMPLDIVKDIVNPGKERKGNGIYDANEATVKDVLVELVPVLEAQGETTPANEHGTAYIYPNEDKGYIGGVDTNNHNQAIAATYTDEDGSYSFNGVVPGHYRVKFTYGEKVVYGDDVDTTKQTITSEGTEVTVQDYKSTIRTGNNVYTGEYWYQNEVANRYSDALDDYTLRNEINKELETMNYKTKTEYGGYSMSAYTDIMDMPIQDKEKEVIEYIENESDEPTGVTPNVDFGIIGRPKQEIEVTKEISYIKLSLASGQVLIDGDPRDKLPYVTYPKKDGELMGQLKLEVDNEILHGSTLELEYEIKVNNLSEIDYNNKEYYQYGIIPNSSETDLVKISINNLIDYMDNNLGTVYKYEAEDGKWYQLGESGLNDLKNGGKLSNNAYNAASNYSTILMLENETELKDMKPNQEPYVINVKASKQLSNSTEDLVFNNQVEVIELSNSSGRFMESSTPGNYEPGKTSLEDSEKDSNANRETAKMVIVPPTGQTRIYYVLGASCIIILAAGIIIIKKKVLDS